MICTRKWHQPYFLSIPALNICAKRTASSKTHNLTPQTPSYGKASLVEQSLTNFYKAGVYRKCTAGKSFSPTCTPDVSSKIKRKRRMYSAAAFSISTLLGFRSFGISGTRDLSLEKPLFKFFILGVGGGGEKRKIKLGYIKKASQSLPPGSLSNSLHALRFVFF